MLDAALDNIASGARVVICGAISQYNNMENVVGKKALKLGQGLKEQGI